jgi:hypothetical protein
LLVLALVVIGSITAAGLVLGFTAVPIAISGWALLVSLNAQFELWRPLKARPALSLTLYHDGVSRSEIILERETVVRPIDRRAIVDALSEHSRETVEPRPETVRIRTDLMGERYDDALARFNRELEDWSRETGAWLLRYESLRWPSASYVEAWVRLANDGNAPAEDVLIEVEFSADFLRAQERPAIDPPPEPPRFYRRAFTGPVMPSISGHRSRKRPTPDLGPIAGPDWVVENNRPIARYRTGTLLHGTSAVSAYPLRFLTKEPGRYEVTWTIRAANLPEPSIGKFVVDARPQRRSEEPARTLQEVLEPEDVPIRRTTE